MQAKGFMGRLGLDIETTFGVSPTTKSCKILPFNKLEIVGKQSLISTSTITGNRNPVQQGLGRVTADGSAEVPVDYTAFGWWLKSMFGPATDSGASAPYTHVFKPSNTQPSLVLEKAFTDIGQYFLYNGCKVSSLKLSFGGDGELVATLEFKGASETRGTVAYSAMPTTIVMNRLNNFQAALKEGGSTIGTVTSGDFTIDFGLDGDQYTVGNGNSRGDIPEGILKVSGTLKALFTDASLIDKGINATESSLELTFTSGTNSLAFKFPEIQYERNSPAITGPAGVSVDLAWSAYYQDSADAAAVVATLKNAVATY
ncbi:hypothetical protein SDC9_37472 [bioreactor metagenome]|uniref:Uncharacterized protein n=1 Tax=bioreactor metagenome TaxID=1076179 RepID=A0A644VJ33_9ZZZZ|nr:phage tail tube protein [Acidaminococcaceae bacterium]